MEVVMSEAYTAFAAKYNYQSSERFKNVLRVLMDEDEVALANMLPGNSADLAQKSTKSQEVVERMLQGLYKKGVIFEFPGGYRPARDIMQLHDSTGSDVRSDEVWGRKLLDAWFDFSEKELFQDLSKLAEIFPKPVSRVVPASQSVAEPEKLIAEEDIAKIVEKSARIAVVSCPCRRVAQRCERPVEVCLQVGKGADYAIKRGSGREVTKKQATDILRTSVEGGLVHIVANTPDGGLFVCNCCPDCCIFMYPWLTYGGLEKGIARSRFEAKVDVSSCSGCQDCVDICPFDAIDMVKVPGEKKLKPQVNHEKCYGCGVCAVNCITDSIRLYEMRPTEHVHS
jgi:Pyruvate/2-oxoacid:ferredoxin oxidoreductase delta subunit